MNDIKKKFIDTFFSQLTEKDKKECYFDYYMWHAFSYEKIKCIEGIKAVEEFKKVENNDVYVIFQHNDIVIEKQNFSYNKLIDMLQKKFDDCYVIDKNFEWCFIFTHETQVDDKGNIIEGRDDWENPYYIGPFFKKI